MIPWRPLIVFLAISVGTTTAIAGLCAAMGWSVSSPAWAVLAPIAMWAPFHPRSVRHLHGHGRRDRLARLPQREQRPHQPGALRRRGSSRIVPLRLDVVSCPQSLASGLHSFHNTISQWLFPKFFAGGEDAVLLGEGGVLPVAGYIVLGSLAFLWMRWRGPSWQELARAGRAA